MIQLLIIGVISMQFVAHENNVPYFTIFILIFNDFKTIKIRVLLIIQNIVMYLRLT